MKLSFTQKRPLSSIKYALTFFAVWGFCHAAVASSHLNNSNNLILLNEPSEINYSEAAIQQEIITGSMVYDVDVNIERTNNYDKHGVLTDAKSINQRNDDEKLTEVSTIQRLSNGGWKRTLQVHAGDQLVSSLTFHYSRDIMGHITTENFSDPNGALILQIEYGYDPDDRVLNGRSNSYDERQAGGVTSRSAFTYNKNLSIAKYYNEIATPPQLIIKKEIVLARNKANNLEKEIIKSENILLEENTTVPFNIECKFTKFDNHNNWVEKKCTGNNTMTRKITYY